MPGQMTRGDMVFTWTEILGAQPDAQQAPFVDVPTPPYSGPEWQTVAVWPREDGGPAVANKPFEGRAELEIDRNYWKSEAKRYKQLLMDMLGKEVE